MIKNTLISALKNWKTTSLGIMMGGGAIIHLIFVLKAGKADETTWTITLGAVLGGIGLIAAGDAGQSDALKDALARIDALEQQGQTPPK